MNKGLLKIFSIVLILFLVFGQASVFAADYSDIDSHWANKEITKWSNKGLLMGSDGLFKPGDNITRAEMAVIIDRLMRYDLKGDNIFSDLADTWFTDAILKNNRAGVIKGSNGIVRPNDFVTRQEAVVMISRAMDIKETEGNTSFKDNNKIANWARGYIKSFSDKNYISGHPDGSFRPNSFITRAAIVKMIDNILAEWINESGIYTNDYLGNVIINTDEVTLKELTVYGDLIIAEGVGDGEVNLDNVVIKGNLKVRGGGENSIYLKDTKIDCDLYVEKQDGKIRIVASGNTSVKVTRLSSGALLVESNLKGKGFEQVIVPKESIKGSQIVFDGEYDNININVPDCNVTILGDSKIDSVHINSENTNINCEGTVEKIDIGKDGKSSKINGKGNVKSVSVGANNVTINTKGTKVKTNVGIKGTKAGGKELIGGKTTVVGDTPKSSGGSGGSSNGSSTVAVTSVSIDQGDKIFMFPSETKTLTATVKPNNATNKKLLWTRTSSAISINNDGDVTVNSGIYNRTAAAIVSSVSNSSATDTIVIHILQDNLQSIGNISDIHVNKGTEKTHINFPDSVNITCDTGETLIAELGTWRESQGVIYDKDSDGSYTFETTVTLPAGMTNTNSVSLIVKADVIISSIVDAVAPVITTPLTNVNCFVNESVILDATATVTDGGTITYQWYDGDTSQAINGATNPTYTVPTSVAGTYYFYCKVLNTNNSVTGDTTEEIMSTNVKILVSQGVIEIDSIEDLAKIGNDDSYPIDGNYKLTMNLDFTDNNSYEDAANNKPLYTNGQGFTPIGGYGKAFTGVLDGDGHTISNLMINKSKKNVGLFYSITNGAEVVDLGLVDVDIQGESFVGGITGVMRSGAKIENCYTTGVIKSNGNYVGGITGLVDGVSNTDQNTLINKSFSTAEVKATNGYNRAGGIVGENQGVISNSYSTGDVYASNDYAGGIAGKNVTNSSTNHNTIIKNCYSTGNVTSGGDYAGGIAGYNTRPTIMLNEQTIITNCYSLGDIEADDYAGGIVGKNHRAQVTTCYATGDITATNSYGDAHAGGIVGISTEDSTIKGNIAFASSISSGFNATRISHFDNMTNVVLENNYANTSMVVTENGSTKTGTSNATSTWGADRANMTGTTSPYDAWDFDSDKDGDGAYWKIYNNRPVLFIEGSKLGNDDGSLTITPVISGHQIHTVADLQKVGTGTDGWDLDDDYVLACDIDADGITNWSPLGDWNNGEFKGVLDGAGYTISNLTFTGYQGTFEGYNGHGFFKQIGESGVVKNIVFKDPKVNISNSTPFGLVTGRNYGEISNIEVRSSTETLTSNTNIAGIAYINRGGTIKNCSVEMDIASTQKIGGIVHTNKVYDTSEDKAIIKNCYYSGTMKSEGNGDAVGGIAYESTRYTDSCKGAFILNCYSKGEINSLGTGADNAGGIVAYNDNATVSNCYSTASVKSDDGGVGGIAGNNTNKGIVNNCYSTGNIIGENLVGGIVGANADDSSVQNCIAFNDTITANRTPNTGQPDIMVARVLGYNPDFGAGTISNNYAKASMSVMHPHGAVNPNISSASDDANAQGADIDNLTTKTSAPLSSWDFDSDGDSDGVYWKIVNDRPLLYVDKGNGAFEKLGTDNGQLVGVIPASPFEIRTVAELQKVGTGTDGWDLDSDYVLKNDIDLSSVSDWIPIGNRVNPFNGEFDGAGYTISNMTVTNGGTFNDHVGFIGKLSSTGILKNVDFTSANVSSTTERAGIAVGRNDGGTIDNVSASGSVSCSNYAGGIVSINKGLISNCTSTATVNATNQNAGGIAGNSESESGKQAIISNSYTSGTVNAVNGNSGGIVGGLCGDQASMSIVRNCYSTGNITCSGTPNNTDGGVGGIAGVVWLFSKVENCYSISDISSSDQLFHCGGIAGRMLGTVENCYAIGNIVSGRDAGGIVGRMVKFSPSDIPTVSNCIAFNSSITGESYSNVGRIGYKDEVDGFAINNNYASSSMMVTKGTTTLNTPSDPKEIWGIDISNLTTVNSAPLSSWDFDNDGDSDGAYWKIENDRPVLYVDKGNGTFEKLGTDNGLIAGNIPAGPFDIYTASDLQKIGNAPGWTLDETYNLKADLDLTGVTFTPIGTDVEPFTGFFYGENHVIDHLTISDDQTNRIALFGKLDGAKVKDLGLTNVNITGKDFVGGIAGYMENGSIIENAYVTGEIKANNDYAGGIAGYVQGVDNVNADNTRINKCYTTANVTAQTRCAGGITGENTGAISYCYTTGKITAAKVAGGIAGINLSYKSQDFSTNQDVSIKNCYSKGDIESGTYAGGIVGCHSKEDSSQLGEAVIEKCYSLSNVTSGAYTGGIAGFARDYTTIANVIAFSDTISSGLLTASRITIYEGTSGVVTTNQYAKAGMTVTEDGKLKTTSLEEGWGTDIDVLTETSLLPLSNWEFNSDTNTDGAYWEIMSDTSRPVIYVNDGTGTFVKLGDDDGLIAGMLPVGPFDINTVSDLQKIGNEPGWTMDETYNLKADLDLTGVTFTPIGTGVEPFTGVFNGEGHVINNLTINDSEANRIALFGKLDGAKVKDLGLTNVNITGKDFVGGIAGYMENGSIIENAYVTGEINATSNYAGGIAGYVLGVDDENAENTQINKCYTTANVTAGSSAGGIAGKNTGAINYCYTTGDITAGNHTGGIVGINASYKNQSFSTKQHVSIKNCYSKGDVTATMDYAGGIVGYHGKNDPSQLGNVIIGQCYSLSNVSSAYNAGGIAGYSTDNTSIGNVIAFGDTISVIRPSQPAKAASASRITTYEGISDVFTTYQYAKTGMTVTEDGQPKTTGAEKGWGNNIDTLTKTLFPPLNIWEFDSDINSDGAYWKIMTDTSRPIIYVDDGTGTFVKLGDDDGLIAGMVPTGPFDINTASDLQKIGNAPGWTMDETYNLRADIDLSSLCNATDGNWTPIGTQSDPFTGRFNGNNFTINNLYLIDDTASNIGLFGYTDNAHIDSFTLDNVSVRGNDNVGAFIGYASDGTYSRLTFKSGSVSGMTFSACTSSNYSSNVGGIVGYGTADINLQQSECRGNVYGRMFSENIGGIIGKIDSGSVAYSFLSGSVDGQKAVGGIAGKVTGDIDRDVRVGTCYVEKDATVEGDSGYIGGIAGEVISADIKSSYVKGNVTGSTDVEGVGGIVGHLVTGDVNTSTMTDDEIHNLKGDVIGCYSAGEVKINGVHTIVSQLGGVVGKSNGGIITFCYSLGDITGYESHVGGIVGYNGPNTNGSCAGQIHSSYSKSALSVDGGSGNTIGIGGIAGDTSPSSVVSKCYAINDSITYDTHLSYIKYNAIAGIGNGGIQNTQYKIGMVSTSQGTEMTTSSISKADNIANWDYTQDINQGDDGYWWMHQSDNTNQVALRPTLRILTNPVGDDDGSDLYNQ